MMRFPAPIIADAEGQINGFFEKMRLSEGLYLFPCMQGLDEEKICIRIVRNSVQMLDKQRGNGDNNKDN